MSCFRISLRTFALALITIALAASCLSANAQTNTFTSDCIGNQFITSTVGAAAQLCIAVVEPSCAAGAGDFADIISGPSYQGLPGGQHTWFTNVMCRDVSTGGSYAGGNMVSTAPVNGCDDGSDPLPDGTCQQTLMCDGSITGVSKQIASSNGAAPAQVCDESSGCVYNKVNSIFQGGSGGSPSWEVARYSGSATDCGPEPTSPTPTESAACVQEGGTTVCASPDAPDQNCATINDSFVCLDSVDEQGCAFLQNGDMVCGNQAGTPPGPDNGTPGVMATPDDTISTNAGDTFNIYNNNTVGGSSGPTSGNDESNNGMDPSGNGEGGQGGTGTGAASFTCDVQPACDGDPIQCAILIQNWVTACQDIGTEAEIQAETGLSPFVDPNTALTNDNFDLSTGLDSTGYGVAGACLIDIDLDLGATFGTHTIPLSNWCPIFSFMGVLVLLSASLVSVRIVAGGF